MCQAGRGLLVMLPPRVPPSSPAAGPLRGVAQANPNSTGEGAALSLPQPFNPKRKEGWNLTLGYGANKSP